MTGKKILVTGSRGLLGSSIIKKLQCDNIVGLDRGFDITNQKYVLKILNDVKPDIIIHAAAYTNVEDCEFNQDKAYIVNTIGTQNIVNYCINKDILFIYISSTGIYGTSKNEPYSEFDDVRPTTIHHKSKYEAEKIVKNHLNQYLILRTGWLYGGEKSHNKNFVYKRFLEADNKDVIYSDDSQIGNPTYVIDFIEQISVLIKQQQYGLFNCVNEANSVTRYDYVKKIVELFEIKCSVEIAPKDMFKRIAPVSSNESAQNYKLNLLKMNTMPVWDKSLIKYINILKDTK